MGHGPKKELSLATIDMLKYIRIHLIFWVSIIFHLIINMILFRGKKTKSPTLSCWDKIINHA